MPAGIRVCSVCVTQDMCVCLSSHLGTLCISRTGCFGFSPTPSLLQLGMLYTLAGLKILRSAPGV